MEIKEPKMNGTRPMLFTFDNDGVAADFVKFIKDFRSDRGTATLHVEQSAKSTIVESLKLLGITSDKLTEQVILFGRGCFMKCRLVMEDWRQVGKAESIYSTPLGVILAMGDMHSGTTFEAVVELPPGVADEIETAWREHDAYPVLRLMPNNELDQNKEAL